MREQENYRVSTIRVFDTWTWLAVSFFLVSLFSINLSADLRNLIQ